MSEAGKRLIEGAKEALAIAKGEQPAARIWHQGHSYVPEAEVQAMLLSERKETIERCAAIAEYDGNLPGLAGARIAAAIRSLGRE